MKVRMKVHVGGLRNGKQYPAIGEVMELQEGDTGDDLLRNGYAEKVGPVAAVEKLVEKVVETAAVAPAENAAKRTRKPAPSKGAK